MTGQRKEELSDLLVMMPALNEAASVGKVIAGIRQELPGVSVLVVDDGSSDDTVPVARAAGAAVLSLPFNLGIGVAVQAGILYALEHGYQWLLRLDGDGQHDPRDIHRFWPPPARQPDQPAPGLVIGSRFLEKSGFQSTRFRRAGIGFLNLIIRLLTGFRVTDATSGFQLYSRPAMENFRQFYPDDYPEPEAIIMIHKWGLSVTEVPVDMKPRPAGTSSINFFRSVYYMIKVTMAIILDKIRY